MTSNFEEILTSVNDAQFFTVIELCKIKRWLATVVAFANEKGGVLVFGADEKGEICGVDDLEKSVEFLKSIIDKYVFPVPGFKIEVKTIDKKNLVMLRVDEGEIKPYSYTGDSIKKVYVRDAGVTRIARSSDYRRLKPRHALYGRDGRYRQ